MLKTVFHQYYIGLIFFFILTILSFISPIWGYDEYASVISHLEFNDPRYVSIYFENLQKLGVSEFWVNFLIKYIIPIIIVPLRWTYSLGLSPTYELARFIDIDWVVLRPYFLSIHNLLSTIGLILIIKTIRIYYNDRSIELFFTALVLLSLPFIYWTITLSSYSYHLFCFGLFLHNEHSKSYAVKIFSRKALFRSILILFNYQYIFVLFLWILFDYINEKKIYIKEKLYKEWVLTLIIGLGALMFLFARSILFSKHNNPAQWLVSVLHTNKYDITMHLNSLTDFISFFSSRIYDIISYYFQKNDYHILLSNRYSNLDFLPAVFIFLIVMYVLVRFCLSNSKLSNLLSPFFVSTIFLYVFNIYPFMPSRHSLVMFLPFALLVTVTFSKLEYVKLRIFISFIILIFGGICLIKNYNIKSPPLNIVTLINTLEKYKVERLILKPCELEPIFSQKKISSYRPLYRCGPMVIEKIKVIDSVVVAVYSKNMISFNDAILICKDYILNDDRSIKFEFIHCVNQFSSDSTKIYRAGIVNHSVNILKISRR